MALITSDCAPCRADARRHKISQLVVFHGESGSGKTENANLLHLFYAATSPASSLAEELLMVTSVLGEFGTADRSSSQAISRRRDCHFADNPVHIPIETPAKGRGGCSRMKVSPTAAGDPCDRPRFR